MISKPICQLVDFQKAFDSLARKRIWQTLRSYGIPEKFVCIIRTGMTTEKVWSSMKEASQIGLKSLQALSKAV